MTLQEQIIVKQDELIEFYELLFNGDTTQYIHEAKLKKDHKKQCFIHVVMWR